MDLLKHLDKTKRTSISCTTPGQVSGEKRIQGAIAYVGIQQHKNPAATKNKTRLMLISLTELSFILLFGEF